MQISLCACCIYRATKIHILSALNLTQIIHICKKKCLTFMCIVTSPGVEASDDHGPVRIQTTSSEGLWEPSWTCASKVPQRKQYFVFFKVCAGWSMLCNHMVILWVYLYVFVVCIYTYIHMYVYAVMCPYFVSNFICIAACWLLHVPFFFLHV